MGEDFWPSIYPGLIVGLLYGLAARGPRNVMLGVVGGFAGSSLASLVEAVAPVPDGFIPLALSITLAAGVAFVLIKAGGGPGGKSRSG